MGRYFKMFSALAPAVRAGTRESVAFSNANKKVNGITCARHITHF